MARYDPFEMENEVYFEFRVVSYAFTTIAVRVG